MTGPTDPITRVIHDYGFAIDSKDWALLANCFTADAHVVFAADQKRYPGLAPREWLGADLAKQYPLHLLTIQPPDRLHGQLDPGPVSRAAKVAGREAITISPADAAGRGIAAGDVVRVWNDRGACLAGAKISDAVRPGVVILPTGAWYDAPEPGGLEIHGNPNVLTADRATSRLSQGSSAQTVLVEIERYAEVPPALRVFAPPTIAAE